MYACLTWLARDFLIRHRVYNDLPPACDHPAEDCPPHDIPAEPAPPGNLDALTAAGWRPPTRRSVLAKLRTEADR